MLRFPKSNGAGGGAEADKRGGGGARDDKAVNLGATVMRLVVGCISTNDPKKSSAGSFEV